MTCEQATGCHFGVLRSVVPSLRSCLEQGASLGNEAV